MAQRINGFTAQEWYMIAQALLREIRTIETAQEAVTNKALAQTYEKTKNEYIRLAGAVHHYYTISGGSPQ
jgi:fucose permease